MVAKTDFDDILKNFNQKNLSKKTTHLVAQNELRQIQTSDSIYFRGKSHFEEHCTQNYLVFQPLYRCFKRVAGVGRGKYIYFSKSKVLSDENITTPTASDHSLNPQLSYLGTKTWVEIKGSCLKEDKTTYTHIKIVNIYIVYEKDILIVGKGLTQGLEHTLSAEKMHSINFTGNNKKFCLSLHYNGLNSYLFVNGIEIYKFKAKDSEIVGNPLCLVNISKDRLVYNMKKTGLNGYIYNFRADYDVFVVDDILHINKYLMKK